MGRQKKIKKGGQLTDAIIYKIFRKCNPKVVYIGSSFKTKIQRLNQHKADYKQYLKGNNYHVTSFELVKFDDVDISVIENVKVKSEEELDIIEDGYIIKFRNDPNFVVVNKNRVHRTPEEKRQNDAECKKRYEENHKEEIKNKRGVKVLCSCGAFCS